MPPTAQLRADVLERAAPPRLACSPPRRARRQQRPRRRDLAVRLSDSARPTAPPRAAPPPLVPHQAHRAAERREVHQHHRPLTVGPQRPPTAPTRRPRRPAAHMHPQRPAALVADTEHLHIAQSHQQLAHARRVVLHRDPPVIRLHLSADSGGSLAFSRGPLRSSLRPQTRRACNATISKTLHDLRAQGLDFSPTFCFIDPDALDVDWSTLSTVASFKNPRARTKPEMLILLSHTTIPRLAGWDSSMGLDEELSSAVTAFDGTQDWRHIHSRRTRDGLGADDARTLYTELFRYRIQQVLGYRRTLTIEMGNERGAPVYVLVFCTDHDAGVRIMSSVFAEAREQSAVSSPDRSRVLALRGFAFAEKPLRCGMMRVSRHVSDPLEGASPRWMVAVLVM